MSEKTRTLRVKIRTLTPLWTGGVDGTMDRIHETGIIGSLRWWYEAIVRGLGGSACDPTSKDRCPDDGKYCDVCAVFGATGLQRTFRLEGPVWLNEARGNMLKVWVKNDKGGNNKGWFLGRGFLGESEMQIVPLHLPEGWKVKDLIHSLCLIMRLIECWGGLGARTQQGYGVVKLDFKDFKDNGDIEEAINATKILQNRKDRRIIPDNKRNGTQELPTLNEFFFAKVQFSTGNHTPQDRLRNYASKIWPDEELNWYLNQENSAQKSPVLPLAPVVRYYLRGLMRHQYSRDKDLRHRLMGELGKKSLIHVSHAYPTEGQNKWEFRIWGRIPDDLPGGVTHNTVLERLRQWMGVSQDVSQQRQWHDAQNGQLWQDMKLSNLEVCWFEKHPNKSREDYLKALMQCNCEGG